MTPGDAQSSMPPGRGNHLGIVVGIDGSEESHIAVHVAADEAARRELPLMLVSTYSLSPYSESARETGSRLPTETTLQQQSQKKLDHARRTYLKHHQGEVWEVVKFGDPATVLRGYSSRAQRLVVGTRGWGRLAGRLAGSVSTMLPAQASCPTLVVPLPTKETSDGHRAEALSSTVTVGVDGSEASLVAALEAAQEAQSRRLPLRLVRALPPRRNLFPLKPDTKDLDSTESAFHIALTGDRDWLSRHYPDLEIQIESIGGASADVLVKESIYAEVTVLGTTGGGLLGRILGSTSQDLIRQGRSPILIVPYRRDPRLRNRKKFPGGQETAPARD